MSSGVKPGLVTKSLVPGWHSTADVFQASWGVAHHTPNQVGMRTPTLVVRKVMFRGAKVFVQVIQQRSTQ